MAALLLAPGPPLPAAPVPPRPSSRPLPQRPWRGLPTAAAAATAGLLAQRGARCARAAAPAWLPAAAAACTVPLALLAKDLAGVAWGVQDPGLALPKGCKRGRPQRMAVTEEQRVEFAEEGVVMVKGGLKAWVDFLRQATEHQVGHPHLWSVLGRGGDCYGYMQRNVWMTNDAFYDFSRLSPLGHILAQLGGCEEVRLTTDMLLVNPKQDLCWHQDNQNGPIEINSALRWWVALDDCGERGAPEFLKGSQRNGSVADSATSVDIDGGDLPRFAARRTAFMPEAGDLIIWDSRTIHRLLAPEKATLRRAHSGTAARAGALYVKRGAASAMTDLAEHDLQEREPLAGACFPRIYPSPLPQEEGPRERHELVSRSPWRVLESLQPLLQRAANLETNRAAALRARALG